MKSPVTPQPVGADTAPRSRRSTKGEQTRGRIVLAASTLFSVAGYRGTSIDQIASAAGIGKSALLHHFPTKEHLLITVIRERLGMDGPGLARLTAMPDTVDIIPEYIDLVASRFTGDDSWTKLYTVLIAESVDTDHPAAAVMRDRIDRLRHLLKRGLRAGIREGSIRSDIDLDTVAATILGLVDGLRVQHLLDPGFDPEAAFRSATDALLRSLAPTDRA